MKEMNLLFVANSGLRDWGWILTDEGGYVDDSGKTTQTINSLLINNLITNLHDDYAWNTLHNQMKIAVSKTFNNNDEKMIVGEVYNTIKKYYKEDLGIEIKSLSIIYNCKFVRTIW